MVKRDRPLPDRPFYYIISGHNKSTLLLKGDLGGSRLGYKQDIQRFLGDC
jgi:hypothetical protein